MKSKYIDDARILEEQRLRYNPLKNLTPQKIVSALDDFQYGYLSNAAKMFDAIKRREGIIQACIQKRKRATARLTWTIVEMGKDENQSAQHAEFLENFYNNIEVSSVADTNKKGSMSMLISNILTALESQYSVSELIWKPNSDGSLGVECRYVPLWCFENLTGALRFKEDPYKTNGIALNKNEWLVAVSDCALMEATACCYIIKRFATNDWTVFSERFGGAVPIVYTAATANSDEWKAAENFVSQVAQNLGGVLSTNDKLELLQANSQGLPMPSLVNEMNRMIALIWRGSDLSTLSAGNSTGASLQAEEAEILEDADCALVEETLAHYLTLPALEWKFGRGVKPAAYLQLTRKDRKDKLNQLSVFRGMTELGCPPAKRDVYESLNIREPEEDEDIASISTFATDNNVDILANSKDQNKDNSDIESEILEHAKARALDIQEVLNVLEDINNNSSSAEEYLEKLEKFKDEIFNYSSNGNNEKETLEAILKRNLENGRY